MLSEFQTNAVWENMLAAEARSLYFADLASRYTRYKQWISGLRNLYRLLPFARSTYRNAAAIIAASSQTYAEFAAFRDKLAVRVGDRDPRHHLWICDHQVITALGLERYAVAEGSGGDDAGGEGDAVGVERPLQQGQADVQVALHARQRGDHNDGVEDHDEIDDMHRVGLS